MPHHITQRGNARQIVFDTRKDRLLYLDLLREYAARFKLKLWGYCLMSNHVHLIGVPDRSDSLAGALGRTHAEYARYRNILQRSCGHLWQARYYSCPLGEKHLWNSMVYVERNPVRAGLSRQPTEYEWSSAFAHVAEQDHTGLLDLRSWKERFTGETWKYLIEHSGDEGGFAEQLRKSTRTGRPCCDADELQGYEQTVGRLLRAKPVGRPRKASLTEERQEVFGF